MEPMPRGRQAVCVVATGAVLVALHDAFGASAKGPIAETLLLSSGFAVVLALAIGALVSTTTPRLAAIEVCVLVVSIGVELSRFVGATTTTLLAGTDEDLLNRLAMTTLQNGHNPYTKVYGLVGADGYGTPLLTGGQANTYGYPPLSLEIGRGLGLVWPRLAAPGIVGGLALVGLTAGLFFALPTEWRTLSIITIMGFGLEITAARQGLPVVLACALLCVPIAYWSRTGLGGRLGAAGIIRAVFLGLAASAQQLSWFVAIFLVLSLFLIRRGDLGTRRALLLTGRYIGIAALTFLLVNAPFMILNFGAWLHGVTVTLTQKAIVDGSGWALPLIEAHGGTSSLGVLSYAAILLLTGLLIVYTLEFRTLAPAVTIVPSVAFLLSSRSDDQYFFAFMPLWLLAAATTDWPAVRASKLVLDRSPGGWASTRRRRGLTAVALLVPSVVVFAIGVAGSPPMTLQPQHLTLAKGRLQTLSVDVTNTTDQTIDPQYFIDSRTAITHPWVTMQGPTTLRPHQSAEVVLRPRTALESASVASGLWLFSTTFDPAGMAGRLIDLTPGQVTVDGVVANAPNADIRRLCLSKLFTGHNYDCNSQLGDTSVVSTPSPSGPPSPVPSPSSSLK